MVLNLLRVEEINPEYMLERSFFQFQNNSAIPDLEKQLAKAVAEHAAVVIPDEENAFMFYEVCWWGGEMLSSATSFLLITAPTPAP